MPTYEVFNLPDVGEGLTEADIARWLVAEGEEISVNQTIIEIETAKSLVELPSPFAGVVHRLMVAEGEEVPVGSPLIEIDIDPHGEAQPVPPGEVQAVPRQTTDVASQAPAESTGLESHATESNAVLVGYGVSDGVQRRRPRSPKQEPAGATTPGYQSGSTPPILAKPPVRKLAKEMGIDLTSIHPTGPGGIVTREDVLGAHEDQEPRPLATYTADNSPWLVGGTVSQDGRHTRVPIRSVRKRTAEAVVASAFTAPHVTVFHTVDVTRTMKLTEKLRADKEFSDVRVTPLLIAAKALLIAVNRHPEVNASWDEERHEIVYKHYVNLGIAAATPRGLIVPNIKDAHRMGLHELAEALQELTLTARSGKTSPGEMMDGTISITNVGTFGIDSGTPILNPGESAILAFGAITRRPWEHKGKIKLRWVTQLALSFDHRLIDGVLGAILLADVARIMQDPARAIVWG